MRLNEKEGSRRRLIERKVEPDMETKKKRKRKTICRGGNKEEEVEREREREREFVCVCVNALRSGETLYIRNNKEVCAGVCVLVYLRDL